MKKTAKTGTASIANPVLSELRPGQSIELLKELHILTRDGKLNQDTRRKLKQVYHLYQFIEPLLKDCETLVDHGAGKSYLGFILYDLFFKHQDSGSIIGIESRQELVESSQALAIKLAFPRMAFLPCTVEESFSSTEIPEHVDVVTALHACNTATDDAIRFALSRNAKHLVLVPCCQAEVAAVMRAKKNESLGKTPLSELWRHPIHTRELGSHLTNVLRCLLLESHGYDVTVTELVGWEHSMKNELIIASKKVQNSGRPRKHARERAEAILHEFNIEELASRFTY